jgi:UDP-N-acetylmuramate--alanine ligase
MLAHLLAFGGINPTAIIGGKLHNFDSNARVGEGDYIVFEADESDGTFLKLLPTIAIVTNIDADHLDYYKYFNNIKSAFLKYINKIPFYGYSALCIDDATIREILPLVERPYITYGFSEDADVRAVNVCFKDGLMKFDCLISGELFGEFSITSPGNHNVQNSLSVIAVAKELGLDSNTIKEGFRSFKGIGRRFEKIDDINGILIMDDYGHHPTEIRATLDALKNFGRRLVVIFQPHRYSRTQVLCDEFGQSFSNADVLFLADIYPAGEAPIEGVSSGSIAESIFKHEKRKVESVSRFEDICDKVFSIAKSGDIIITLGAGDIYKAGRRIAERLRAAGF